jgi:hypothetical protein
VQIHLQLHESVKNNQDLIRELTLSSPAEREGRRCVSTTTCKVQLRIRLTDTIPHTGVLLSERAKSSYGSVTLRTQELLTHDVRCRPMDCMDNEQLEARG